jgi:hypothetical protein
VNILNIHTIVKSTYFLCIYLYNKINYLLSLLNMHILHFYMTTLFPHLIKSACMLNISYLSSLRHLPLIPYSMLTPSTHALIYVIFQTHPYVRLHSIPRMHPFPSRPRHAKSHPSLILSYTKTQAFTHSSIALTLSLFHVIPFLFTPMC